MRNLQNPVRFIGKFYAYHKEGQCRKIDSVALDLYKKIKITFNSDAGLRSVQRCVYNACSVFSRGGD